MTQIPIPLMVPNRLNPLTIEIGNITRESPPDIEIGIYLLNVPEQHAESIKLVLDTVFNLPEVKAITSGQLMVVEKK